MAVYHIAGIGTNPGVLTVPLSIVYILQAAQALGVREAEEFFKSSGEKERDGSYERMKGMVECVIAFTSKEVIEGKEIRKCNSNWFNFSFNPENQKFNLEKVYKKFFDALFGHFEKEFPELELKKFEIFLVEVNHSDFEDCFKKIGITLNALMNKELWGNLIGGSNQINFAILTTGAYIGTVSRYYYVFQNSSNLLEPEWAEKPTRRNIYALAKNAIERWNELPIFSIDIGDVLKRIAETFEGREKVNKREIEKLISDFGLDNQYLAKLRGILEFEGDLAKKGYRFEKILGIWKEIKIREISNFPKWKSWAEKEGILHEIKIFES